MKKINKILLIISIILGGLIITATLIIKSIDKIETARCININNNEEIKTTFEVTNVLRESTNNFYLDDGEIGIEFSNNSFAIANLATNKYTFQADELGDWSLEFDNLQDFEKCIKTYISIKNSGSY